jgi:hypothetical protein
MAILLNALRVSLSGSTFTAWVADQAEPEGMRSLRETFRDWFLHWRGGRAYGLPIRPDSASTFGTPASFQVTDNVALGLIAARLGSMLPNLFPKYEAIWRRPFAFLGQKDELVSATIANLKLNNVPEIVRNFSIRPKFELDPRLTELRDGGLEIALVIDVGMKWDVTADLPALQAAGVDLSGLHIVRRVPKPNERRLVGRIGSVEGDRVILQDSFDGTSEIAAHEVWLEGSTQCFARCLRHLLGARYAEFNNVRYVKEAEFLTGPALLTLYNKMNEVLKGKSLDVAPNFSCTFEGLIHLSNTPDYRTIVQLPNPEYCFDAAKSKRSQYAWTGLERYGPYSRDSFPTKSPRILVLCPDKAQGYVEQFIRMFRDGINSVPQSRYASGFSRVFGLTNPQFVVSPVPVLGNRGESIAMLYRRAAEEAIARATLPYHAGIVVIPDQYAALGDNDSPYLFAKAVCLMAGIPTQEAKLSTLTRSPEQLIYVAQNFAVALYAKLGGVPWTVDHDLTVNDEVVIGMGSIEMSGSRFETRQRHIGITTVFRGDGNYLLSNVSRECSYAEYPALLKSSTLDILRDIRSRNGWQRGDTVRLVFHAYKPLKNIEVAEIVAECIKELGTEQTIQFAFLTVSHDHPFKLIDPAQQGSGRYAPKKGVFVPERGNSAQLGRFTRLVCTNGPSLIKKATAPLPSPILVRLHPQSSYGALDYLAEQVLKFTSLSWRSTLPCTDPVTIYYSELIAGLLARLRAVPDWSPSMLNVKLRASRWFL